MLLLIDFEALVLLWGAIGKLLVMQSSDVNSVLLFLARLFAQKLCCLIFAHKLARGLCLVWFFCVIRCWESLVVLVYGCIWFDTLIGNVVKMLLRFNFEVLVLLFILFRCSQISVKISDANVFNLCFLIILIGSFSILNFMLQVSSYRQVHLIDSFNLAYVIFRAAC